MLVSINSLDFDTLAMFENHNSARYSFTQIIVNKTNYLYLDEIVRNEILTEYFILNPTKISGCGTAYNACTGSAQALHTLGIVTCTIAAIGVASGTLGAGGIAVQAFC